MNLKDIKQIVELMNEHELSYFHLEQGDFNIKLKKGPDAESIAALMSTIPQSAPMQATPATPQQSASTPAPVATVAIPVTGQTIDSPMVGTFYRKPSPEDPNFVEVGDIISEGQTICIIEAMKVMNEIKADKGGKVTSIAADDSTPVQFGDTLFTIE